MKGLLSSSYPYRRSPSLHSLLHCLYPHYLRYSHSQLRVLHTSASLTAQSPIRAPWDVPTVLRLQKRVEKVVEEEVVEAE